MAGGWIVGGWLTDALMDGWMDGWVGGRWMVDGCMDGWWMDG